ncbi:MAG: (Z)-2-((N-methylformamido)methylene)-5-hydroxybutyrolactone dehydrogenase [Rhodospirillaceae bacterium]|jgi:acyl-CoA reductase-like NAD-dependent aldehyde dehydrogenase|nr:(Z)-2-((N-methylformamido)methylene)-5-hydroxybutyrolactone dehydrogenase [Rhodospirillaceae bacterium]
MTELVQYQMLIDGKWVGSSDGVTIESVDPSTGRPWCIVPDASAEDTDRAVRAAHRAFTQGPWPKMTPTERGKLLRRLAELMVEHSETLGRVETIDTGKLFKETRWQGNYVADYYHYFAGLADKVHGETLPIDKRDMHVFTVREPLGVVAGVIPWNSQILLAATKLGPALAAGNTIVLKASEMAPAPLLEFGKLIGKAGFPDGVVNIISGSASRCSHTLTTHPLVARIAFTGGDATARHIIRNSAENLARVTLELGGKSPVMVFNDADLESATNGTISGIFGAAGQTCVAGSRVFLQEDIADQVLSALVDRASAIRIGNPLDDATQMGPLATQGQLSRIESAMEKARAQGANVLCGGGRPSSMNEGFYFSPTIVDCRDSKFDLAEQELFGPVLCAFRFKDEEEAIAQANDTRFGLAAGIFTRDLGRAHRVAKATRSGIVWVNTYRMVSPIAEFGGMKDSGYGRESGMQAIYDYTTTKTIWINTSTDPIGNPFVMR